ncbi:hypothetical protein [Vandammella animalimorsus]|uniref:hypothetical protein n=1 Tax=Vandammella animalimorsus TaxID=2029117 RepID=UPI001551D8C8|nr:hypothetical protein [Vandammella animalimorsus]
MDRAALIFACAKGRNIQKTCNIMPPPWRRAHEGDVDIWLAKRFSMKKSQVKSENAAFVAF